MMEEELNQYLQCLVLSDEEKEPLLKAFKGYQKKIVALEFMFKRTLVDKTAITNILNASIEEVEKQKKIIEHTKDEVNRTLIEMDQQKKLIEIKNNELSTLLSNLKATQSQLIQSEKMASLGELTAGISHEIQNPLNFVNNFSDINKEMIAEMKAEIDKGNYEEVKLIADDIEANEQKISHHGRRADGIVKGMLQHSRTNAGKKEPTDLNVLTDEYLRLSYHGLRAKDKSFNAEFKTNFDTGIGKINVVPQDMGRVLLNLFNNAFYAVTQKKKQLTEGYHPTICISTTRQNNQIKITVRDNGNGISNKVLDKMYQPFFTTKPTGEGTGLGLSISYDIITQAHNGTIEVNTQEGQFAEFIITLPVS